MQITTRITYSVLATNRGTPTAPFSQSPKGFNIHNPERTPGICNRSSFAATRQLCRLPPVLLILYLQPIEARQPHLFRKARRALIYITRSAPLGFATDP